MTETCIKYEKSKDETRGITGRGQRKAVLRITEPAGSYLEFSTAGVQCG